MSDRYELTGRRVLVTGGTRGLGEAMVRRFADAGATVLAAGRSSPADDLPARFLRADLATPDGPAELARRVVEESGGVDVLVDNAGATAPPAPVLERSDESWRSDLDVNLMSAVRLDRELVPGMVERGYGVVVHVSSIAARLLPAGSVSYAAAKAALNAYSRSLAVEVGPHGVRVVTVLPGFVATPGAMAHHQRLADRKGVGLERAQHELAEELAVPMRRPGTPEEAAELVVFLASDRARWLTGAQYRVDGGILGMP